MVTFPDTTRLPDSGGIDFVEAQIDYQVGGLPVSCTPIGDGTFAQQQESFEVPALPAAGYLEEKRLPWSWAELRLERSRTYWLSAVTTAGRPHSRPYWGVWQAERLYFSSGSRIRKHLERSSDISLNLESGDECVIVEGSAAPELDLAVTQRVVVAYDDKYRWNLHAEPGEFYALQPRVAFGWLCDGSGGDGGAAFQLSATRWHLPGSE